MVRRGIVIEEAFRLLNMVETLSDIIDSIAYHACFDSPLLSDTHFVCF